MKSRLKLADDYEEEARHLIIKAHYYRELHRSEERLVDGSPVSDDTTYQVREAFKIAQGPLKLSSILTFLGKTVTRQRVDQILKGLSLEGEIRQCPAMRATWLPVSLKMEECPILGPPVGKGELRLNSIARTIIKGMTPGFILTRKSLFLLALRANPDVKRAAFNVAVTSLLRANWIERQSRDRYHLTGRGVQFQNEE